MIGLTAFMDLGPAVGTANLAAKTAGMPTATYFVHHQIPVAVWVIGVVAVLIFVTARHFDRGLPAEAFQPRTEPAQDRPIEAATPLFYALIPLVPIALILVFSPLLVGHIAMDVVTAMIIGSVIGLACELAVKRDVKVVFKGFQVFFNAIGAAFASIVSLLVCADVFAQGLQAIGAVGYMIDSVRDAGFGVNVMAVVMALMVGATAMITGSGVAAFFAFSGLAPAIAAKFGVSAVTMVLPMQLMAGMGRAISPVAGVIIAVAKTGQCSPFEIVRRTMIPSLGGMATMLLLNYLLNG
jgi:DcuC family C4-dicarboxylate transporter